MKNGLFTNRTEMDKCYSNFQRKRDKSTSDQHFQLPTEPPPRYF